MWWEITEDMVYECLRTLWFNVSNGNVINNPAIIAGSTTSTKNFDSLVEMVANYYDVSIADIKWESRKYQISKARQMLMYLARKHFKWQYERIGEQFWKNYATVMHSVDVIEESLKSDPDLQHDYRIFADWIQQ